MKDAIAKYTSGLILILFWLTAGVCLSPLWLIVVTGGALIGEFKWREVPRLWFDMVTLRWFFEE